VSAGVAEGPISLPALIFLIGYRGTGKTVVAPILAGKLAWRWLDLDDCVEAQCGKSIRDIFAAEGEAGFRQREAASLEDACGRRKHVVATGGGTVLRPGNRERMRSAGAVIWLTASAETLRQRIELDPRTAMRRPDLAAGGLDEIREMSKMREPLYRECAQWTISTDGLTPEAVADAIVVRLKQA
jgi:shikimate kinase